MTCPTCGEGFDPPRPRVYCSDRCREKAKYERDKASGLEQRKRDLRNARYVPHPVVRGERSCSEPGCNRKHLALGMCRSHYSKAKGYDRRIHHRLVIGALVVSVGRHVVCERAPFGGMWVWCPDCGFMVGVPDGDRPDKRQCAPCDLSFLINAEEMEVLCAAE